MPNATASPATIYPENNRVVLAFESQSPLDYWLDKLAYLESEGKNNLKILDVNGLHSFGCLQFQMGTFREFGLRYGYFGENDDLSKLIYNCNLQKSIAKRMLEENRDYWKKWYTSVIVRGLGLPPKQSAPILVSFNGN